MGLELSSMGMNGVVGALGCAIALRCARWRWDYSCSEMESELV